MAKLKKGGEHTKEALEFIFCMFNEHELFGVIERLIKPNSVKDQNERTYKIDR